MVRNTNDEANMTRILRRPDVEAQTGLSRSGIYDLMKAGKFPRPVPLGEKAVGWIEAEIEAWIEARVAEREAPHAMAS